MFRPSGLILQLFVVGFLGWCEQRTLSQSDAELRSKIIGTWKADYDNPWGHMEKTFDSDGRTSGFILFKENDEIRRVNFVSSWQVENGYLKGTVLSSDDSSSLSPGDSYTDKIISVTDREFVTIEEGCKTETRKYK
jgi:hypothetical protein